MFLLESQIDLYRFSSLEGMTSPCLSPPLPLHFLHISPSPLPHSPLTPHSPSLLASPPSPPPSLLPAPLPLAPCLPIPLPLPPSLPTPPSLPPPPFPSPAQRHHSALANFTSVSALLKTELSSTCTSKK